MSLIGSFWRTSWDAASSSEVPGRAGRPLRLYIVAEVTAARDLSGWERPGRAVRGRAPVSRAGIIRASAILHSVPDETYTHRRNTVRPGGPVRARGELLAALSTARGPRNLFPRGPRERRRESVRSPSQAVATTGPEWLRAGAWRSGCVLFGRTERSQNRAGVRTTFSRGRLISRPTCWAHSTAASIVL